MTPDQVTGFFDAGESFVEGTIAAALVALWMLALALHIARPYMVANLHKFTLRLGADLWWILYVGLRDILTLQLFLGGFIFFYPDVVAAQDLPITGGLAAVCAFAVMLIKLTRPADEARWYRYQAILLAVGATLYVVPYILGVQLTNITDPTAQSITAVLVSSQNLAVSMPLCYLSGALAGILGLVAVVYNLRQTVSRPRRATA
ncbi:MAG TPA: hypothetical protein VKR30_06375 [Candidatus Limnocylindrales bacterium]|nr:hypothetical protein [Candidatus Limnocylindrales bacterium]